MLLVLCVIVLCRCGLFLLHKPYRTQGFYFFVLQDGRLWKGAVSRAAEIAGLYQQIEEMNPEVRYSIWHALQTAGKLVEY